ncbi:MAG: hypothetical protein V1853_02470 [bacterium]
MSDQTSPLLITRPPMRKSDMGEQITQAKTGKSAAQSMSTPFKRSIFLALAMATER